MSYPDVLTETHVCLRREFKKKDEIFSLTWFNCIVYHRNKLCDSFFSGPSDAHFSSCKDIKQAFRVVSTDILSLFLQRFISKLQALAVRKNGLVTWIVECGVALSLLVHKQRLVWSGDPLKRKVMVKNYKFTHLPSLIANCKFLV